METSDVSSSVLQFEISDSSQSVIIYMHCVSDAQYFYGVDGFEDLHQWLLQSVELCRFFGYQVYIKPHPSFFRTDSTYNADIKYLKHLNSIWGVDISNIKQVFVSTKIKGLHILNPDVSILEIKNNFNKPLIITHHGSIALEAMYLKLNVLVSTASPYNESPFIVYHDVNTLKKQLNQLKNSSSKSVNRNNLLSFVNDRLVHKKYAGMRYWFLGEFGVDSSLEINKIESFIQNTNVDQICGFNDRIFHAFSKIKI